MLYKMGNQASLECDSKKVFALAATNGEEYSVLITNVSGKEETVAVNVDSDFRAYLIDEEHMLTPIDITPDSFTLEENQVILLKK